MIAASMPVPDFQGSLPKSIPIEQKHETVIDPGREKNKKTQQNSYYISVQFTQKLPHSDPSTAQDCSWRLVREESKHGALIFL